MLKFILCFATGLLICCANAEVPNERKQELRKELGTDQFLNVTKYSTEEKQWILDWILDEGRKQVGLSDAAYDTQLLQLGHIPTIEKYGRLIAGDDFQSPQVMTSRQPRLIKYFEPIVLKEEPAWMAQAGHITLWRRSISAMAISMEILVSSQEASGASRAWAADLLAEMNRMGSDDPKTRRALEESRSIFRDWWKENKAAFLEERFGDIKPGKIHSFVLEKQPKPEPITPAESVIKRPESRSEAPSTLRTGKQSVGGPQESSNWYWVVPAVCVALLVGLVAAFRKKR